MCVLLSPVIWGKGDNKAAEEGHLREGAPGRCERLTPLCSTEGYTCLALEGGRGSLRFRGIKYARTAGYFKRGHFVMYSRIRMSDGPLPIREHVRRRHCTQLRLALSLRWVIPDHQASRAARIAAKDGLACPPGTIGDIRRCSSRFPSHAA